MDRIAAAPMSKMTRAGRLPSLDGLRGVLAVVVMLAHFTSALGEPRGLPLARTSVYGFFVISAYALTVSWESGYLVFVLKRFVRLWPAYAAALAIGTLLTGFPTPWHDFFWVPFRGYNTPFPQDPVVWSLYTEVYASAAMPLIVLAAKRNATAIATAIVCCLLSAFQYDLALAPFFIAGAYAATRVGFDFAVLNWSAPQWLGKISYSLYLTHAMTIITCKHFLPHFWMLIAIPFSFGVAMVFYRYVEAPSIQLSRALAKGLSRPRVRAPRLIIETEA